MKQTFFRLTGALLCVVSGGLLSLLELRFFEGAIPTLPLFFVIAVLTIPAVFLYLRSGNSVVFLLLYTVGLVLALEALGLRGDLWIPLTCLFVLTLMYIQMQLMESARQAVGGSPASGQAFAAALACGVLAVLSTFQIYKTVLVPRLPEEEKFAFTSYIGQTDQTEPELTAPPPPTNREAPVAGDPGQEPTTPLAPSADLSGFKWLLQLAVAVTGCILLGAAIFQYLRYRIWRKRTLAAPRQRQIIEFYRYFLRCLAVCGCPRAPDETPLEYLRQAETEGFLFSTEAFSAATGAFLTSFYGGEEVSSEAYASCLALFRSTPRRVIESKGLRFYFLYYLRKMYWSREKLIGSRLKEGDA